MMKKYLDTNIFLYPVLYEDEKAKICGEIIKKAVKREILAVTSVLTWDEFVYALSKFQKSEIYKKEGKKFLHLPIEFLDANKTVIYKAQTLIEKYNLKPRDAIHAASALHAGAEEIISDDSDFDKIKELKRISPENFKN